MKNMCHLSLLLVVGVGLFVSSCAAVETGTLEFRANGEDFVREGFVSKDGWSIEFENLYVTLDDITAYQTNPPYDPDRGNDIDADVQVTLDGPHTIDLAQGNDTAEPVHIGEVQGAPIGHYNALSWQIVSSGTRAPLVMVGKAQKDEREVAFTLQVDKEYGYVCGEFIGDERKGFLLENGRSDVELTFHFDHIFGDAQLPLDDELNLRAPGFDPLAALARDNLLTVDMADLEVSLDSEDYQQLVEILPTLGHVGEGHCASEEID